MSDRLENEMLRVTEHLKKYIMKTQEDLSDGIRELHKLRARDKSDYDLKHTEHRNRLTDHKTEINKHKTYFDTLAQSISIIAENINMQMEAEYADLFDRKMMALYGGLPQKGSKADFTTKLNSKAR